MTSLAREIVQYHELICELAMKELRVRYKRSLLGFFWALLHPLLMMIVLTTVFSQVMRVPVQHYSVFLISALLPWTFFSQALSYSVESIVANGARLNPIGYALDGFRDAIYYGRVPAWPSPALTLGVGLLALWIGYAFFRRVQHSLVLYV